MDKILELDRQLLLFINQDLNLGALEYFIILIRKPEFWIPLYVFMLSYLLINHKLKGLYVLLLLGLVFFFCDQMSSNLMKPFIERTRPCNNDDLATLLNIRVRCGSGFSFTSSHATNHFGIAMSVAILFKKANQWVGIVFLSWAAMISFAQVYVGVHYPLDVLAGACLGSGIGFAVTSYVNKYLRFSPI